MKKKFCRIVCKEPCELIYPAFTYPNVELQKPVWHFVNAMYMSGSEMKSSRKSARWWHCQPHVYICEHWTVYQRHAIDINYLHLGCLGKVTKIKGKDKTPNTDVMRNTEIHRIHAILKLAQLRCTDHENLCLNILCITYYVLLDCSKIHVMQLN